MLVKVVTIIFFVAVLSASATAGAVRGEDVRGVEPRSDEALAAIEAMDIAPGMPAPPLSFRMYDIGRFCEAFALSDAQWAVTMRIFTRYQRGWRERLQESIDRYDFLRTRVLGLLLQDAPLDPADDVGLAQADARIDEAHAAWTDLMAKLPEMDGWFLQRVREQLAPEQRSMLHELRSRRVYLLHEADIPSRGPLSRQCPVRKILDELSAQASAGETPPVAELREHVTQFIISWEPEYLEAMLAMTRAADEAWPAVLRHRMRHRDSVVPREAISSYADALLALEACVEAGLTRLGAEVGESLAARVRGRMERTAESFYRSDLAMMETFLEVIRGQELPLDRAAQVTEIMSAGQASARRLSARLHELDRLVWRSDVTADAEAAAKQRGERRQLQRERESLGESLREEVFAMLPPWQAAEVRRIFREAVANPAPGRGLPDATGGVPSLDSNP